MKRMKSKLILSQVVLGLLLAPVGVQAQDYWKLTYQGTLTSGQSNKLSTVKVTEKTFVQNCASNSGISTDNLALVLHFNGSDVGDTLEVVNVNDPNLFRCEVFKLAFPESYTNSAGALKRFAYIYDSTSDHSRGSVVINRRSTGAKKGGAKGAAIDGRMQYWLGVWNDNSPDPNARVGSGTFKATGPLNVP